MTILWIVGGVAVLVVLGAAVLWLGRPRLSEDQARRLFKLQREHLEADFLARAQASGKPRGLRWIECTWENLLEFGRDRRTRQMIALVAVTIRFEAIEGSDMEGLPAVSNLRNATALFFLERDRWRTTGVTVFNHNPDEVLTRYQQQYERLQAV